MTNMAASELTPPRDFGGKYVAYVQGTPQVSLTAPSAEVREAASLAELISVSRGYDEPWQPIDNDFDRDFHGNPDGARVAALARAEGVCGMSSYTGGDTTHTFTTVVLARTDESGETRTLTVPFSTPSGTPATSAMVFDAVLSDSAGLNDVSGVEDWADAYGYDLYEQSSVVRDSYQAALTQDADVRDFLGTRYDEYLWGEQA